MPDREKVMLGLELCSRPEGWTVGCLLDCPYDHEEGCRRNLMMDAIALLKAQEPPTDVSISSAIECLLHPQDADDSDMAKAIDTAVRAMRLLKAQDPRVLTLEEAREALKTVTIIWLEVRCDNEVYACLRMRGKDYFVVENGELLNVDDFEQDTYGKDYDSEVRCWSSRPTDAQREATPWE